MGSSITGWGTALPERELHNSELAARLDLSEDWIVERTGIRSRRIASEGQTTSLLAAAAGAAALGKAGISATELDLILVATCTPDYQLPPTGPLVGAALGATGIGAFDINAACSGFLYGLAQASALIEAGTARRVLVCGADILSRVTDYEDPKTSVLFGDGAGAAVLEKVDGPTRVGPFRLLADGSQPELLWIPETGGCIQMEGRDVYRRAVDGMTRSVRDVVVESGMSVDDVDLVIAHQANARILEAVASRLGLPQEKVVLNISRYGNTSAASIPIAISEAVDSGVVKDNDVIVMTAFGAGFTWGAGIVRWGTRVDDTQELAVAGRARG
jgi:3-oxoacyl-[acyl-carrier-protein] synthase III